MGRHRDALAALVLELRDAAAAEAYCTLGGAVVSPRTAHALGERLGGGAEGERRAQPPQPLSVRLYRELVGVLELLAAELGLGPLHIARQAGPCTLPGGAVEDAPGWLHPARGAQVLAELGVHDMILLTNTHHAYAGLEGYGLSIIEERPIPGTGGE